MPRFSIVSSVAGERLVTTGDPAYFAEAIREGRRMARHERHPKDFGTVVLGRWGLEGAGTRTPDQLKREGLIMLAWLLAQPTHDPDRPGKWGDYAGRIDIEAIIHDTEDDMSAFTMTVRAVPGTAIV